MGLKGSRRNGKRYENDSLRLTDQKDKSQD